jgi:hypothetical protein
VKGKTACLIINPRLGENLAKLTDMIAVFSAAGWKTETLLRIDRNTTLVRPTGEPVPAAVAAELPAGGVIVVEGKLSKRGVIRAKRLVVMT